MERHPTQRAAAAMMLAKSARPISTQCQGQKSVNTIALLCDRHVAYSPQRDQEQPQMARNREHARLDESTDHGFTGRLK